MKIPKSSRATAHGHTCAAARPSPIVAAVGVEIDSPWNPRLPPAFVPASDTQNPANRRRGEECVAQRVVGRERIRECEDDRFGTRPVGFRGGFILCLSVQIGPGGMNAPRRRGNLEPAAEPRGPSRSSPPHLSSPSQPSRLVPPPPRPAPAGWARRLTRRTRESGRLRARALRRFPDASQTLLSPSWAFIRQYQWRKNLVLFFGSSTCAKLRAASSYFPCSRAA